MEDLKQLKLVEDEKLDQEDKLKEGQLPNDEGEVVGTQIQLFSDSFGGIFYKDFHRVSFITKSQYYIRFSIKNIKEILQIFPINLYFHHQTHFLFQNSGKKEKKEEKEE